MRGYRPSKGPKGGDVFTSDVTDVPEDWDWRLQGVAGYLTCVVSPTILMG